MFRTLFTMACCAVAWSQAQASTVITNSTASITQGAAWGGLQFSFADTANSRLTTAGGLASLGQFVSLDTISFTNISTGSNANWSTNTSRILVLLDSANKIVAWSDTVNLAASNGISSPTFTFGSAPSLDTTATYKFAFSDSARVNNIAGGLVVGNTFTWSTSGPAGGTTTEIRAQGSNSLSNYGNTTNSASLSGIGTAGNLVTGQNFIYAVDFNVTPVPEPSTALLGVLSLSGLLLRRRRK